MPQTPSADLDGFDFPVVDEVAHGTGRDAKHVG